MNGLAFAAIVALVILSLGARGEAALVSSSRIVKCILDGGAEQNSTQFSCDRKMVVTLAISSSPVRRSERIGTREDVPISLAEQQSFRRK